MTTVLQIIPSLGAGGAEQACVDVAAGLAAAGYRSIAVSSGGPRMVEIAQGGSEAITHNVKSKNPAVIFGNALWLANLIRRERIDIVHARSRAPAWSAYLACRMAGCAFVTTNHAAYKFSNAAKKLYNSVMAKGDRVIAISNFIADEVRKNYGVDDNRLRIIPRGVDLEIFAPEKVDDARRSALRETWNIREGRRVILLPSRLSAIKGQAVLIEAMALLPPELSDAVAVIIGDDQGRTGYRQKLENLIENKGLKERMRLAASCRDMAAAYSLASLVVATSLVPEGFGRVPVEAMAMGVPVVATELGAFKETIREGETGFLVPPEDAEALAKAVAEILNLPFERRAAMTREAMQTARTLYGKKRMVAATLAVYDELMQS